MRKTFEQVVLEAQTADCRTEEELFLLWQLFQQMEPDPYGETCYGEIDSRSFHIDGIVSKPDYNGVLYIMKESSMRKQIQKGNTFPVISDLRYDLRNGESRDGEVEYMEYLTGMQKVLDGEQLVDELICFPDTTFLKEAAVLYLNKRGGKGAADEISMQYAQYYIEFIRKQIELIDPSVIVCCGEDVFRLIVMEVFRNKHKKKNHDEYMRWKNLVFGDVFMADDAYYPTGDEEKAHVKVIRMWNPSYRVNNGQYVSLNDYLKEFRSRVITQEEKCKEN